MPSGGRRPRTVKKEEDGRTGFRPVRPWVHLRFGARTSAEKRPSASAVSAVPGTIDGLARDMVAGDSDDVVLGPLHALLVEGIFDGLGGFPQAP